MSKASILLEKLAEDLINPDSEVLMACDHDPEMLNLVSFALLECSKVLKETAADVLKFESHIDTDALDEIAMVAAELDKSGLDKYSESIDDLLDMLKTAGFEDVSKEEWENDIMDMSLKELAGLKGFLFEHIHKLEVAINKLESESEMPDNKMIDRLEMQLYINKEKIEFIDAVIEHKENESLDHIGNLAVALDSSGDKELEKLASVLDEIMLTIGAPKDAQYNFKVAEESELEKLRMKYRGGVDKYYGVGKERRAKISDESNKVIQEKVKKYRANEAPLSTRCCVDHPGQMYIRVGDGVFQCPLDRKIYNYESGFKMEDGTLVPGASVSQQTQGLATTPEHMNFSTRTDVLNG